MKLHIEKQADPPPPEKRFLNGPILYYSCLVGSTILA